MNKILFQHVLPQVFAGGSAVRSDVWQQELAFERGRCYLIEADSGKGKSTFCSYVVGYRHDYAGSIFFDDTDTRRLKTADWVRVRRRHISCLFQDLRLFPELTALENVEIKNRMTGHKQPGEIEAWFERLGIADKRDQPIGHMSYGQQQRVALMRALAQPFDFLLADEPISHLDDTNAQVMGEIMVEEARRQGAGILATSIGKHLDLPYDAVVHV